MAEMLTLTGAGAVPSAGGSGSAILKPLTLNHHIVLRSEK